MTTQEKIDVAIGVALGVLVISVIILAIRKTTTDDVTMIARNKATDEARRVVDAVNLQRDSRKAKEDAESVGMVVKANADGWAGYTVTVAWKDYAFTATGTYEKALLTACEAALKTYDVVEAEIEAARGAKTEEPDVNI